MNPATAALIGAGVGSVVAVGSQFLNHAFAATRDRRNQKRELLYGVIIEAAEALYKNSGDERPTLEEFETRERHPESFAARNPELSRDLEPMMERTFAAISLLQIHFGHDHWLIGRYTEICGTCAEAERAASEHRRKSDDERLAAIPEMYDILRGAQEARDAWMRDARAEVERI